MKKALIFSLLVFAAGRSFSQSLEDINGMLDKKQTAAARVAIDKYTENPKNATESEGWYFKGYIYNSISREPATSFPDAYNDKIIAFDAFKKNQQLDKLDLRMKSEFYRSYFDLYLGFYDLGAKQFNAKDFTGAYKSFNKAQETENFIMMRNYTSDDVKLSKIDTALILNTGAAALQAGDTLNGIKNYRKIVDADIAGKDNEAIYEYLAGYYNEKKDESNLQAILAKAKAAYPQNTLWNDIEMDKLANSGDKNAVLNRYEELYKSDPTNFTNDYNYAVTVYNTLYGADAKNPDPALKEKLSAVLKSAMAADAGIDAAVLMASHEFNWAADYSTNAALIKGTKPDDVKKKKELNDLYMAKMNEAIPYGEKVVTYYKAKDKLTTKEKLNYKSVLNNLSDIYNAKGDAKKAAEYDKIADGLFK